MLFLGAAPPRNPVYQADRVCTAPLAYTPDGMSFAPVLTERSAYPSQAKAQFAFERVIRDRPHPEQGYRVTSRDVTDPRLAAHGAPRRR
ncbi:MAG: hypothetical protein NTZ14_19115 [Hyphomicrobiales bacterium]|nr:hypothetical protein [Hyphomicrobiales bacterium]